MRAEFDRMIAHSSHALPSSWESWHFSPTVGIPLVLLTLIYSIGLTRLRKARGPAIRLSRLGQAAYYAAIAVLIVALLSPVDALSDWLLSVHMVQHTLIMMVAAPLMAQSSPGYVSLWALPSRAISSGGPTLRRLIGIARFNRPIVAWALYAVTLWFWHLPAFYEAALRDELVHDFQHLGFFATSFLFWRVIFEPYGRPRLQAGAGLLYLFVASLHAMILGVLMALSPSAWYAFYAERAPLFGLSALEDQQIAGYIMWMPAGLTYVVAAAVLATRLLRAPLRR